MANLKYRGSTITPPTPGSTTANNLPLTNDEIDGNFKSLNDDVLTRAPLNSPDLTGTPTAPTAAAGTNTTQIANTAHVFAERTNTATLTNKTLASPSITGTMNGVNLILSGDLTVNGTTTTINSTTVAVDDINIELGSVTTPTDATANGGGITLKGSTDKTIVWDSANTNWTSSENWNIASGKSFKINNSTVLTATGLGSSVVSSSLTSVGTLGSLAVSGSTSLAATSVSTLTTSSVIGVGGATTTNIGIYVRNSSLTGVNQYGASFSPVGSSAATSNIIGIEAAPNTSAAAYTTINRIGLYIPSLTKGAGSTITNDYGISIADTTQGTNNYGISVAVSSGANKWNIYASGTANNAFAGNVRIGSTVAPTVALDVTGAGLFTTNATQYLKQAASAIPTVDMFQITNAGFGVTSGGVSALQVNYIGGAAAVEASAARIDITPGATTGGTWNGLRIFPTSAAATGVTYNALKFDTVTPGAGTDNIIYVGTGYDNILNYNGTVVINGAGNLIAGQLSGTIPSAVLGASSLFVGTTSIALNRASAALALTGISSVTSDTTLTLNSTTTSAVTIDSGTTGAINIGTNANAKVITIGNATGATGVNIDTGTGGIYNTSTTAVTNSIANNIRLNHQTTGTPAAGIGVGIQFEQETSAGNTEIGMRVKTVTTDVTAASEDFDFVVDLMAAGAVAAEKMRVTSVGNLKPAGLFDASAAADTATAATHYYVETATDGFVRPKTLANTQTEIVTATSIAAAGALAMATVAKSAAYTVVAGDRGDVFSCTSTFTLTLTAAATLGAGFSFGVVNAGSGTITIDPNASELIDGATTITVPAGKSCFVICDAGTSWRTIGMSGSGSVADGVLYEAATTIASNYTVSSGKNALGVGKVSVNTGVSLTVPTGQSLVVVGAGGNAGTPDQYVGISGNQTITGVKNFTATPLLNGVAFAPGVGVGQTWQNVAGSRAFGTTYYNTTGKPILVCVVNTGGSGTVNTTITVAGVSLGTSVVASATGGYATRDVFVVPDGASYVVSGSSIGTWVELR